jgi:hypothetical protein
MFNCFLPDVSTNYVMDLRTDSKEMLNGKVLKEKLANLWIIFTSLPQYEEEDLVSIKQFTYRFNLRDIF